MQSEPQVKTSLDLAAIEASLKTNWLGRSKNSNELWESIDSTNNRAIELGRSGADSGVIVIASQQTAGRGRGGNVWHSPAHSGLYMSFLIKPNLALQNLPIITLVAGTAVVRAIQTSLGIKVGLKWVNDLIVEGKKVGGILAEYVAGTNSQNSSALVIGLGLNLCPADNPLPGELQNKIGFLGLSGNQKQIDGNRLVACIANELETALEQMPLDLKILLDQWRAYSVTLGEEIIAKVGNDKIKGQAIDITDSGALIVKTISENIILTAGEVKIRRSDGSYA